MDFSIIGKCNPIFKVNIDKRLRPREHGLNFSVPIYQSNSYIDTVISLNDLNCTSFEIIEAAYKLNKIDEPTKIRLLEDLFHSFFTSYKLDFYYYQAAMPSHSHTKSDMVGTTDTYKEVVYDCGPPQCFLADFSPYQITQYKYTCKNRERLLNQFTSTSAGFENIVYYDMLKSCVETFLRGIDLYAMDILYPSGWMFKPLMDIYGQYCHLLLKFCAVYPELSLDYLRDSLYDVLRNLHIRKLLMFSPLSKEYELQLSASNQPLLYRQKLQFERENLITYVELPAHYKYQDLALLPILLDKFVAKLRVSNRVHNFRLIRSLFISLQNAIRQLRLTSNHDMAFKAKPAVGNLYLSMAIICDIFDSVRLMRVDAPVSPAKILDVYDDSSSIPDAIFNILIEAMFRERNQLNTMATIANYFKKVDFPTITRMYLAAFNFINTLICVALGDKDSLFDDNDLPMIFGNGTIDIEESKWKTEIHDKPVFIIPYPNFQREIILGVREDEGIRY